MSHHRKLDIPAHTEHTTTGATGATLTDLRSARGCDSQGRRPIRVGWDLDGVSYDFRASQARFEVGRGNAHYSLENAGDNWNYFEAWGMSVEEWLASYADGVDAGVILWTGEPLPGAIETARRVRAAGHTNHVITDRSIGADPQGATKSWLEVVGFEYDTLDFSRDKRSVPTDIFLEDKLENADALNAAGTLCYLINRPWNLVPGDNRPRIDTVEEYFDRVQEHARRLAA